MLPLARLAWVFACAESSSFGPSCFYLRGRVPDLAAAVVFRTGPSGGSVCSPNGQAPPPSRYNGRQARAAAASTAWLYANLTASNCTVQALNARRRSADMTRSPRFTARAN